MSECSYTRRGKLQRLIIKLLDIDYRYSIIKRKLYIYTMCIKYMLIINYTQLAKL